MMTLWHKIHWKYFHKRGEVLSGVTDAAITEIQLQNYFLWAIITTETIISSTRHIQFQRLYICMASVSVVLPEST